MNLEKLNQVAEAMVVPGKGILAADESSGTIAKRLGSIDVESTEENRRTYREMLFRTQDALKNHISGVILYDETIRQKAADGTPLVKLIEEAGALPGIKVDMGAKPQPFTNGEKITHGLDGLRERLKEYRTLGARFAKWRAVISIGQNGNGTIPSRANLEANAQALARYAALCQEQNIVPIVEPEVLMDGDHDMGRCYEVTEWTLKTVFDALYTQRVALEGIVLKPNMVLPGKDSRQKASPEEVAMNTIQCFKRTVPAAVPGIAFLSGGQSDIEATANLNAMNEMDLSLPWKMTFSYGRALQAAPLKMWGGEEKNINRAQRAFAHRAHMNSLATRGKWNRQAEDKIARAA